MSSSRSRRGGRRDARFLWQILLVVPPVVVLSAAALYSLRQDRASIEQDARRNAGALAPELARRVGERLDEDLAAAPTLLFGLILDGRIRLPVDYPALPTPPAWLSALTEREARLWRTADAAAPPADLAEARRAAGALSGAPAPVRANAEWSLARAEAMRDGAARSAERLADLAARYPDVASESGTPIADLALLLALRHSPGKQPPESLVRNLKARMLEHPSFMTPALVEEANSRAPGDPSVAALETRWRANERALDLLRRLPVESLPSGDVTVDKDGEIWLALMTSLEPQEADATLAPRSAFHVMLVPATHIERVLRSVVADAAGQIPPYAAVNARIGDRVWRTADAQSAGDDPVALASAAGRFDVPLLVPGDAVSGFAADLARIAPQAIPSGLATGDGPVRLRGPAAGHAFAISVTLAAPDTLYASYRRRFWLAMGLILTATLAALGGLASTWKAFQRQRRLSEMKSNFVSSVSHELRAPIAAVRLMTESLERGTIEGGARQQEYLRAIVQECRRLSSLVENVLDFSRIDQGRSQYTFEPADVAALSAQTVELMRPYAAERQIGLVHSAPPSGESESLQRRIDREALQQALINLIDNAIKHSPAGAEVTVGVELGPDDAPEGGERGARGQASLGLFVEDRGAGIPEDDQQRIFEPFYRRGSELRRETPGIGIGLTIVKHIAEAHGGRVVVRSSPGSGSRFTIELPRRAEPEP